MSLNGFRFCVLVFAILVAWPLGGEPIWKPTWITVCDGTRLAGIYVDDHCTIPSPNPLLTDASGKFYFCAPQRKYTVMVSSKGGRPCR